MMNIEITPEAENAVNAAVLTGGYDSPDEYIDEAVKNYLNLKLRRLNEAIGVGIEQAERGELIDAKNISFRQIVNKIQPEVV